MLKSVILTLLIALAAVFCCAASLFLAAGGLGFLTGLLSGRAILAVLGLAVFVGVLYLFRKQDISTKR